jgi:hypothetical protein
VTGFWNRKPKDEKAKAPPDDEMACPDCGTIVNKNAAMCYACGENLGGSKSSGKRIT